MQIIYLCKKASSFLNIPFIDAVRAFLIAVESVTAALLSSALLRYAPSSSVNRLLILGIALNPVSIFQVCQHCNFDVLVGFWILLAVYMLLRYQEKFEPGFWLFACFALGMGVLTKTIPLCLTPLLLLSIRKLKRMEILIGMFFLFFPVILALSVVYVMDPQNISAKVLGYRSGGYAFGFSGLFASFGLTRWLSLWPFIFEVIYGAVWIAIGIWLWRKETLTPEKVVLLATLLLMAIPALGPGYGLQYVYWFLPLLVLAYGFGDKSIRLFTLLFYAVTTIIYTIEYAFDYNTFGAFFLEIIQTEKLVKFGLWIATAPHQTFLTLPLWVMYLASLAVLGIKIAKNPAAPPTTER
jgi:hypothetical protein